MNTSRVLEQYCPCACAAVRRVSGWQTNKQPALGCAVTGDGPCLSRDVYLCGARHVGFVVCRACRVVCRRVGRMRGIKTTCGCAWGSSALTCARSARQPFGCISPFNPGQHCCSFLWCLFCGVEVLVVRDAKQIHGNVTQNAGFSSTKRRVGDVPQTAAPQPWPSHVRSWFVLGYMHGGALHCSSCRLNYFHSTA